MNVLYQQKNKGFTLIEMIIAVFIFTVSLAALLSVSARGLRAANLAQRQVTADYLALEGIEAVRNLRDTELLDRDSIASWSDLFSSNNCWNDHVNGSATGCGVSYGTSTFSIDLFPCNAVSCEVFYDEGNFAYRQFIGGTPTGNYEPYGFTREIQFTTVSGNSDEIIVTVVVSWDNGEVRYTEDLYLWV